MYIGKTLAILKINGNVDFAMLKLKIYVRGFTMKFADNFKNFALILSSPVDLDSSRFNNCDKTKSVVTKGMSNLACFGNLDERKSSSLLKSLSFDLTAVPSE